MCPDALNPRDMRKEALIGGLVTEYCNQFVNHLLSDDEVKQILGHEAGMDSTEKRPSAPPPPDRPQETPMAGSADTPVGPPPRPERDGEERAEGVEEQRPANPMDSLGGNIDEERVQRLNQLAELSRVSPEANEALFEAANAHINGLLPWPERCAELFSVGSQVIEDENISSFAGLGDYLGRKKVVELSSIFVKCRNSAKPPRMLKAVLIKALLTEYRNQFVNHLFFDFEVTDFLRNEWKITTRGTRTRDEEVKAAERGRGKRRLDVEDEQEAHHEDGHDEEVKADSVEEGRGEADADRQEEEGQLARVMDLLGPSEWNHLLKLCFAIAHADFVDVNSLHGGAKSSLKLAVTTYCCRLLADGQVCATMVREKKVLKVVDCKVARSRGVPGALEAIIDEPMADDLGFRFKRKTLQKLREFLGIGRLTEDVKDFVGFAAAKFALKIIRAAMGETRRNERHRVLDDDITYALKVCARTEM